MATSTRPPLMLRYDAGERDRACELAKSTLRIVAWGQDSDGEVRGRSV